MFDGGDLLHPLNSDCVQTACGSALPAGNYNSNNKKFNNVGNNANFWSSTEDNSGNAYGLFISDGDAGVGVVNDTEYSGFSVRCLQDSNEEREASLARPSEAGATTEQNQGRIKDPRDGKTYKTVMIGKQTWMAENLNYKTSDSYCYNNNEGMCKKYGRLYKWDAARKACPNGWHLPSDDEWNTLWTAVGGTGTAGTKLKSKSGWYNNGNGTDSFGFAVLPAGYRGIYGSFYGEGGLAIFWSSSESNSYNAYNWYFLYDRDDVGRNYDGNKDDGFSVRCLRNSNEEREASLARPSEAGATTEQNQGRIKDPRDGKTYKTVTIGTQTWMAENLNYNTSGSYCYGDNAGNCSKYGRLYEWSAAMDACPTGWHLPSDSEWNTLWDAVGGTNTAGSKLKSTSGWYDNGNGTDSFGFAVLPAGYRYYSGGFYNEGDYADFWSSTEFNSYYAYGWYFRYSYDDVDYYWDYEDNAFSVRCLRD